MQNLTSQGFRLSPQQRQIWTSQQAFPSQPFRVVGAFNLVGDFDSNRLQQALDLVVGRHEILRTTFARPAGIKVPFQIVSDDRSFFWQHLNWTNVAEAEQQQRIDELFAAERKEPLTLKHGPVLRCQLVELSNTRAVLLLSQPALCADTTTLTNLVAEVCRAYESDTELPSQEDIVQYADFAEWQNELLESSDEQAVKRRAYWSSKRELQDPLPVLPLERRPAGERSRDYESITFETGEELLDDLKAVASHANASLADLLFACWETLISRLSGENNFTIYKRFDARKLEDFRAALGPFERYLPIRCAVGNDSLQQQIVLVADELRHADDAQEYADSTDPGLLSGDAIAFELEQRTECVAKTLSISPIDLSVFSNPFKLKLSCIVSGKQLRLQLEYDRATLYQETCERFSGYLRRLLQAAASGSRANVTLDSIDLLSDDEKRRLLVDLNDTSSVYSHDRCAHELFEAQVAKTPTAVAVVCGDRQLTYEELNFRANQIAHLLLKFGVEPNTCVALCMSRSVDSIVALLGILKAGAAYVPLDPEHPIARLTTQLSKSEATVCLTNTPRFTESLEPHTRVIDLARDSELLRSQPETDPHVVVSSEALAYVIYTSGSTGTPKAVAVRHRNLVNYAEFILERLRVDQPLRFAMVSTFTADLGNTCLFPALFSGGCLHILTQEVALESRLFSDYLSLHEIDVLKIAPSHFYAILSASERKILPSKYLILGGEALSRQLLDSILATPHSCQIINHYGPTETTVGSLTFAADDQELSDLVRTVPIGRPIANTRVYILDQHLKPVPTGVAGELYIGGAGVAVGYLNDPDQTAERFVPDLFSTEPGRRLYRTGDLARTLADGNVEFLGRSDLQIKVRGFRIEPGEIEAVLSEHPLISQAVIILRGDEGHQRFVAYVLSSKLRPANADEIRQYMKQRLPDYMVPAAMVVLRYFPTTPNGKVDRAALPDPEEAEGNNRTVVAPQTSVEQKLAEIWCELLNIREISVHDDFFNLGGHSLLATQVISRIRNTFNKDLPLRTIFDAPTIAKLATAVEAATYADPTDLRLALEALESLSDQEAERLLRKEEEGESDLRFDGKLGWRHS